MPTVILIAMLLCTNLVLASESAEPKPTDKTQVKTVLAAEVKWSALNPLRGKASPRAGNLWGDRKHAGASGFLVKFADGFSSPPHIHNITYRGIVISGLIHNDDPGAKATWMPAGSYWTQPAGEEHITAADGETNIAYIEIDDGPYLVHSVDEAFDNGERAVNVDTSNIVWLDAADITWLPTADKKAQVSFLWGERGKGSFNGALLKLPAGFAGEISSKALEFHAVVIQGSLPVQRKNTKHVTSLNPGSYLGLSAGSSIAVSPDTESIIYIRSNGEYRITHKKDK